MGRIGMFTGKTAQEAILSTVVKVRRRRGMTACWEWQRGKDGRGYGWLTFQQVKQHAHRLAYRAWRDGFDPALGVLHECDNPPCCNPDHLYQGTQSQNMEDSWRRNRKGRATSAFRAIHAGRDRDSAGRFLPK